MVVDVLDVGVVSLHWRLRVLAWGRQCAAAWSVIMGLVRSDNTHTAVAGGDEGFVFEFEASDNNNSG